MPGVFGSNEFIRRVLWTSAVFNLGAATLFAFPEAPLSKMLEMPTPVPPVFSALLAFFVLLFGAMYAWLALQRDPHRPWIALLAIGKLGAFLIVLSFWLLGASSLRGVVAASGDLLLAILFFVWLKAVASQPLIR